MADKRWAMKVTSKGQVTLPKEVRDAMTIREGDYLEASLKDETLVITKKVDVSDSERFRIWARRELAEMGYADPASRAELDPVRLRESLPPLPDMTQRIREDREKQ